MNREEFQERAELDQSLADFLDEITQGADPDQRHRAIGLTLLFGVTSFALYRLAKNYFDYQRGMDEGELRQEMLQEAERLVQAGWKKEKALEAVLKVSKEIAALRSDSPVLKSALLLLKSGSTAHGN